LDLEPVVGRFGHAAGEMLCTAMEGIERFWPARGHAPPDLGQGLCDRRRREGGRAQKPCGLEQVTAACSHEAFERIHIP
jgi:hypothetical protein